MLPTINLSHKLNTFHIILLGRYKLAISKVIWQCNLYILFYPSVNTKAFHCFGGFFSLVFFFFNILSQFSLKIERD